MAMSTKCALLGYHAVSSGNYHYSLCNNPDHYSLCNSPNERSSRLLCGESLKTRMALSDQHLSPHRNCAYIQVYDILKITLHVTVHIYLHLHLLMSMLTAHYTNEILANCQSTNCTLNIQTLYARDLTPPKKIDFSTYSGH
jgi:hypothetical protein